MVHILGILVVTEACKDPQYFHRSRRTSVGWPWSAMVWTLSQVLGWHVVPSGETQAWAHALLLVPYLCFLSQGSGPPQANWSPCCLLLPVGCLYVVHVYLVSIHLSNLLLIFFPVITALIVVSWFFRIYSTVCNSWLYTVFFGVSLAVSHETILSFQEY